MAKKVKKVSDAEKYEVMFYALQFESFKHRFGREPFDNEGLMFDPTLDIPTELSQDRFFEVMDNWHKFVTRKK